MKIFLCFRSDCEGDVQRFSVSQVELLASDAVILFDLRAAVAYRPLSSPALLSPPEGGKRREFLGCGLRPRLP